jgi:hypothetical protein
MRSVLFPGAGQTASAGQSAFTVQYDADAQYLSGQNTFGGNKVAGASKLFAANLKPDGSVDADTARLMPFNALTAGAGYPAYFYNLKADRTISAAAVFNVDFLLVSRLAVLSSKSGNALTFYQDGAQKTRSARENLAGGVNGLNKGDAFLYTVNGAGEIDGLVKVFEWRNGAGRLTDAALAQNERYNEGGGQESFVYGVAAQASASGFTLADKTNNGGAPYSLAPNCKIALYDLENGRVSAPEALKPSDAAFNEGTAKDVRLTFAKLRGGAVTDAAQIYFKTGGDKAAFENQDFVTGELLDRRPWRLSWTEPAHGALDATLNGAPAANGAAVAAGQTAEVTLTPADAYTVGSFLVNGEEKRTALTDGKYTFTAAGNEDYMFSASFKTYTDVFDFLDGAGKKVAEFQILQASVAKEDINGVPTDVLTLRYSLKNIRCPVYEAINAQYVHALVRYPDGEDVYAELWPVCYIYKITGSQKPLSLGETGERAAKYILPADRANAGDYKIELEYNQPSGSAVTFDWRYEFKNIKFQ